MGTIKDYKYYLELGKVLGETGTPFTPEVDFQGWQGKAFKAGYSLGERYRSVKEGVKMNTDLYQYIHTRNGYQVFRNLASDAVPVERVADAHRVAVFVTEEEAADYCRYRNELTQKHGTDELPKSSLL